MPRFLAEAPADKLAASDSDSDSDSANHTLIPTELLSLPDAALFNRLRQTALDLKETVRSTSRSSEKFPEVLRFSRIFFFFFLGLIFVDLGPERDVDVEWKAPAGLYFVYWSIRDSFPGFEILPSF